MHARRNAAWCLMPFFFPPLCAYLFSLFPHFCSGSFDPPARRSNPEPHPGRSPTLEDRRPACAEQTRDVYLLFKLSDNSDVTDSYFLCFSPPFQLRWEFILLAFVNLLLIVSKCWRRANGNDAFVTLEASGSRDV